MTAASPVVSVVMPAFNAARTIDVAIESVLAQIHQEVELIICNDASTDATAAKVREFADPRITLLQNAVNLGEGVTRDRAIADARGDWIAVLDADDAWQPHRLSRLMEATHQPAEGAAGVMIFDNIMECHDTPNGLLPWRAMREPHAFGRADSPHGHCDVQPADFIQSPRLLIKPLIPRRLVVDFGISHSAIRFAGDTEYFLKLAARGVRMRYVPEAMYLYRITPASMSALGEKHQMMRAVLEAAQPLFANDPDAIAAFTTRITRERRAEAYRPFLVSIKEGQFSAAFKYAASRPWVLGEFMQRVRERVPYELHRALHGGKRRGER